MGSSSSIRVFIAITILIVLDLSSAHAQIEANRSLASVLRPDGSVDVAAAKGRSFNARGWTMMVNGKGIPRFVPSSIQNDPDDAYWSDKFVVPGVSGGGVYCVAMAPDGDLYVGGSFTYAGGVYSPYIAKWNGTSWSGLGGGSTGGGVGGGVFAIAFNGTDVYVGGQFNTVDTGSAYTVVGNIAKWNGSTWSDMGNQTYLNSYVHALVYFNGLLYVGGSFGSIGGISAHNIATWNGSTWSALGGGVQFGTGSGWDPVASFAVIGSDLYVGGSFTKADTIVANNVAKLAGGTAWQALIDGTSHVNGTGANGPVLALTTDGTNLYVGGLFPTLGNTDTVNNIVKWDGSGWSHVGIGLTTGALSSTVVVRGLTYSGGTLFAAGDFYLAGGKSAHRVARWNGVQWDSLSTGVDRNDNGISVLYSAGGNVYLGGSFVQTGGLTVNGIARWDGGAWNTLGAGLYKNIFYNPSVGAMAVDNSGNLYITGGFASFESAAGLPVNGTAEYDGTKWDSLNSSALANVTTVNAIAVSGASVYIGGLFSQIGNVTVNNVAVWNGSAWSAMGSGTDGTVNAIAISGSNVYVAGQFTNAGGSAVHGVGVWNGSAWSGIGGGVQGIPNALAVHGNDLYVAGGIYQAGNIPVNSIARWDGSAWSSLGTGVSSTVTCMSVSGNNLFVGGEFATAGGVSVNGLARWDGYNWLDVGGGVTNGYYGTYVNAMTTNGSDLYVGGNFQNAGAIAASNIAVWNGSSWGTLGSGIPGTQSYVYSVLAANNVVYVGGSFGFAGTKPAGGFAIWNKPNTLPAAPTLVTPANAAIGTGTVSYFNWNAAAGGGVTYQIQIATDSLFTNLVFNDSLVTAASRRAGPLAATTKHYWRVRGRNSVGVGGWSTVQSFTTSIALPQIPVLIAPANASSNQTTEMVFSWTSSGATKFRFQLSEDTTFNSSIITDDTSLVSPTKQYGFLSTTTEYFWRVRASNAGGTTDWSPIWTFTTSATAAPYAPSLASPSNNATNVARTVNIQWFHLSNATLYRLQVSTDSLFGTTFFNDTTSQTQLSVGPMALNTKYYWRVQASNAGGLGFWSAFFRFTTTSSDAVEIVDGLPKVFALNQNFPNPFNPSTVINYDVPHAASVEIVVFDLLGRVVATLVHDEKPAGRYEVQWNAANVASGIYFYRLSAGQFAATRKLVLLK